MQNIDHVNFVRGWDDFPQDADVVPTKRPPTPAQVQDAEDQAAQEAYSNEGGAVKAARSS
jgi:hypothetical protein